MSLQSVAPLRSRCDSPIVGATLIGTADHVRTDLDLPSTSAIAPSMKRSHAACARCSAMQCSTSPGRKAQTCRWTRPWHSRKPACCASRLYRPHLAQSASDHRLVDTRTRHFTASLHFAISSSTNFRNSAGELGTSWLPISCIFCCTSGSCMTSTRSADTFATMAAAFPSVRRNRPTEPRQTRETPALRSSETPDTRACAAGW